MIALVFTGVSVQQLFFSLPFAALPRCDRTVFSAFRSLITSIAPH